MEQSVIDALTKHASECYPQESCGVVIVKRGKHVYVPCKNIARNPIADFHICPEDYALASDEGEITHIVHSHPNALPLPSDADKRACEISGLPWIIVNWPVGMVHEFKPTDHKLPLLGRQYTHGLLDCYTLVRDYYKQTLGIELLEFDREDDWWHKGQNLYEDNYKSCDMELVTDGTMKLHDVLFMQINSPVINHAAVYVGDNLIMQHCFERLSSRDVYGGYWRKSTIKVIRHRSLQNAGS